MDASVTGLFVYPVKSCRGLPVVQSVLEPRGLRHDRRWMIVDEKNTFVTQRTAPRLALVNVSIEPGGLVLESHGMPLLRVPWIDTAPSASSVGPSSSRHPVHVWRDEVAAVDCGEQAASWLTTWLGFRASLVYMPEDARRSVHSPYAREGDIVSFADGFPVLIASSSSLDDLNARTPSAVPMDRFRPNIVVSGCLAWSEDSWARVRIGEAVVRICKPCERCVVTTIDQQTAEAGLEPMRTLAFARKKDNAVLFAQNGVGEGIASVAIGDAVTVLERR